MLVVRVELHSAITGQTTEIARAVIVNTGEGTPELGDYKAVALQDGDGLAWSRKEIIEAMANPMCEGAVRDYPRFKLHVWTLVSRALTAMGYS